MFTNLKNSWFFRFTLLVIFGLLMGVFLYQQFKPIAKVQPAIRGKAVDAVPGTLTVEAKSIVDVTADIRGMVFESFIDVGVSVKKDDILLKLDDKLTLIETEKLKVREEAIRKKLELPSALIYSLRTMEEDLANHERQYREGNLSELEMRRHRREYDQLNDSILREKISNKETLDNIKINLKELDLKLKRSTIKAPVSGTITEVFAQEGEIISHGAVICELISEELRIEGRISEEDYDGVAVGQKASIRFLAINQIVSGSVKQVLPTADPDTQQYPVFLEVDIEQEKLVPGLTGEMSIVKAERENALIIPRRSLIGRNHVFTVKEGTVQLRSVKTGFLGLKQAEILSGLTDGEIVILEDLDLFKDGDSVRISTLSDDS
jgi:RND family efflux transporter MFP subunit